MGEDGERGRGWGSMGRVVSKVRWAGEAFPRLPGLCGILSFEASGCSATSRKRKARTVRRGRCNLPLSSFSASKLSRLAANCEP